MIEVHSFYGLGTLYDFLHWDVLEIIFLRVDTFCGLRKYRSGTYLSQLGMVHKFYLLIICHEITYLYLSDTILEKFFKKYGVFIHAFVFRGYYHNILWRKVYRVSQKDATFLKVGKLIFQIILANYESSGFFKKNYRLFGKQNVQRFEGTLV